MTDLNAVAMGTRPADLILQNGRLFRPETESFEHGDLLIAGDRIAGVVSDGSAPVGADTSVLDVDGDTVVPGFIDVHTHLDTFQVFERAHRHALAGGTTTVVTESDRFGMRFGRTGIETFLDATSELPVAVFVTIPAGPFYRDIAGRTRPDVDLDEILELADNERVLGAGEVFWNYAIDREDDTPLTELFEAVRDQSGVVCGHGAGCRGNKLSAFASEIDNDHEILTASDVPERLNRGIIAIGRYGSIRDDIDAFAAGASDVPSGELCLCSDGMWPTELVSEGYMDAVVRRAIEAGIDPACAFKMVTLNAARHLGLPDRGSLSPGSIADAVVLSDPESVAVRTVVSSGSVVVRDGVVLADDQPFEYPESIKDSIHVEVTEDRFRVSAGETGPIFAIEYDEGLISKQVTVDPPVVDGKLRAAPDRDLLTAALIPRRPDQQDGGFTGFVTGLSLKEGAVATSDTWGHPNVLAVGTSAAEMAAAVGRVSELGGGWVVVRDGEVVAELPTPIAGVCSNEPVEKTRARSQAVRDALASQGMTVAQPLLAIGTLPAVGMPWFKLASDGYVDVVENELVGLRA